MSGQNGARERGFSLIELVMALAIFLIVCGVAFEMLLGAMKRYHDDSQLLNSFQEARFGLDQMVRDVNDAGFPPRNQFEAGVTPAVNLYASTAFAWSGTSYPNTPCTIGTNCVTPSDYDLIVETEMNPNGPAPHTVQWVRYKLIGTTLYRGVLDKSSSPTADPDGLTSGTDVLVPYVQNVMNNPPAAQLASLQAVYPAMYPGGNPVPMFQYFCESVPQPRACTDPLASTNDPTHVVGVIITLIVQAPTTEMQTGVPRLVQLKGQGRRINPN
jgi:prepilin-type N-terminal cleavage/methylation domain-containing protein